MCLSTKKNEGSAQGELLLRDSFGARFAQKRTARLKPPQNESAENVYPVIDEKRAST